MSQKYSLYQLLKRTGKFSQKQEIIRAISKGRVQVDKKVTTSAQFQCNPLKREVLLDGKEIHLVPLMYIVLNKPERYSCQKNDDKYPYVVNLLKLDPEIKNSLFVIGRLDVPTTGMLIITNDGRLSTRLLNPKSKVPKKYKVLAKDAITKEQIRKLEEGVYIEVFEDEYLTEEAKVERISSHEIYLTITEGKFRQVRKMLGAVGNLVMALERVAIGKLKLPDIEIGESEILIKEEMYEIF